MSIKAEEIASILDLSWRTIESYVNRIKHKWHCDNKKGVIEKAVASGYLSYVPTSMLSKNVSLVLASLIE